MVLKQGVGREIREPIQGGTRKKIHCSMGHDFFERRVKNRDQEILHFIISLVAGGRECLRILPKESAVTSKLDPK